MPIRLCQERGCGNRAEYRGRCKRHAQKRDRNIKRAGRHVYATKRWKATRRRKLAENPICEHCGNDLATDVHHLDGVEVNAWELSRLEALCHSCHSKETRFNQVVAGLPG